MCTTTSSKIAAIRQQIKAVTNKLRELERRESKQARKPWGPKGLMLKTSNEIPQETKE